MRKKSIAISLSLFIIFIGSAFLVHGSAVATTSSNPVPNQKLIQSGNVTGDIVALNYDDPNIIIGDGVLAPIWDAVNKFDVPAWSDGQLTGYMKAIHDANYIYALIAFAPNNHWAGIEFDANTQNPMQDGHDGWVFGNSTSADSKFFGDVHFLGETMPQADAQKDVTFDKITNDPSGLVIYEVQRALDTHDTAGKDVVFTDGAQISVRFASGLNAQTHKGLDKVIYTLAVSAENLVVSSQTGTSTSTTTTPIAVIKAENFNNILIWGSFGFFFNIILINMLIIYHRRSS